MGVRDTSCCWGQAVCGRKEKSISRWFVGSLPSHNLPFSHPISTALHLTSDIVYPCLVEGASEDGLITNSCCNVKPSRWRPNPLPAPSTIILHRLRLKIISPQSFRINFQQCRFFSTGVTKKNVFNSGPKSCQRIKENTQLPISRQGIEGIHQFGQQRWSISMDWWFPSADNVL